MKITKVIAQSVATKLTKALTDKNDKDKFETRAKIEKHLLGKLPKPVLDLFNSPNAHYLGTLYSIRLCGNGFNYEYVNLDKPIPIKNNNVELPEELAKVIRKEIDAQKRECDKIGKLTDEIVLTLINMRTYKNVLSQFKEAFDLLPPPSAKQLPMKIDLNSIRKQLK